MGLSAVEPPAHCCTVLCKSRSCAFRREHCLRQAPPVSQPSSGFRSCVVRGTVDTQRLKPVCTGRSGSRLRLALEASIPGNSICGGTAICSSTGDPGGSSLRRTLGRSSRLWADRGWLVPTSAICHHILCSSGSVRPVVDSLFGSDLSGASGDVLRSEAKPGACDSCVGTGASRRGATRCDSNLHIGRRHPALVCKPHPSSRMAVGLDRSNQVVRSAGSADPVAGWSARSHSFVPLASLGGQANTRHEPHSANNILV